MKVNVRIIVATNRELSADVNSGRFRSDLFYRLNVFLIQVPPLRERLDDIPLLVARFASKHGERLGRPITRIERTAIRILQNYHWPGANAIYSAQLAAPSIKQRTRWIG